MRIFHIVAAGTLLSLIAGCNGHTLLNVHEILVPNRLDGAPQTMQTVRFGILAGCVDKGWP
jgi:hypothetical protein